MSEWISVKERLPRVRHAGRILIWHAYAREYYLARYRNPGDWRDDFNIVLSRPEYITHWIPLPDPPKEGER